MEVLMQASPATYFPQKSSKWFSNGSVLKNHTFCFIYSSGCPSFRPFAPQKFFLDYRGRNSVVVAAKKKKEKVDSHSFVPKPDEATGPFPEAVLLKEKELQEDGRLLPEFADAEEEKLYEYLNLQLESDLNVERVRHYEVVYLIHEDHVEEVSSVVSKIEDFIKEKKGKIWRLNDWGLRRLAYSIQKAKHANYILMNFELEAKWINDFKSMLDREERVIRHLVIKRDKALSEYCPPPAEFHTLRAGMDDEEDSDLDAYDDEDDGEYLEEEGELDMVGHNEDDEDVIVVRDDDNDNGKDRNHGSTSPYSSKGTGRNLKVEKVFR
ncbi:uncharacterized protein LOC122671001 [Telopea speciosissima]|uniref:uncharacterized protein LOC122671001 n=1 Tax=Telopea speciosissima TaxID=54955 RepID=UPI001CC66BBF|nr:uncharacterized protein LOC122671001 [Telopea speciosissima]